jgi:hypothetical protein
MLTSLHLALYFKMNIQYSHRKYVIIYNLIVQLVL